MFEITQTGMQEKMPNLSVIIPVFNKGKHIEKAIDRLESELSKAHIDYEIVVIDDGSIDNTLERLQERKIKSLQHLKIIHYKNNGGKGYAIRKGFEKTQSECIAFVDGDLDIPAVQISKYYKQLIEMDVDGVIGSKREFGSRLKWSSHRSFLSAGFICLVRFLFPWLKIKDTQVGLKVFKRKVLSAALPVMNIDHWTFDLELLLYLIWRKYQVVELPIIINPDARETNLTRNSVFYIGKEILILFYRWYISQYYQKKSQLYRSTTEIPNKSSRLTL
ncbi:MAG: glycosyltransferase family 2 protein [Promethearchaeota archaeon]